MTRWGTAVIHLNSMGRGVAYHSNVLSPSAMWDVWNTPRVSTWATTIWLEVEL